MRVRLGIMDVDELAHALGEVLGGAPLGDLHLAPGPVDVEEHEQIGGAVAPIFAVVALELPGLAGIGWRTSPMSWIGLSSKQTTGRFGIGRLGIEIEHVLHAGDVFGIDLRNAPHVLAPGLEIVLGEPPAHRLARQLSCSVSLTISPASSSRVQRARPAGGLEQAVATSRASSLPVSLRAAPGRGSSLSAASRLPSTKRRLVR